MSQMTRFVSTGGIVMALCAAFAGCSTRANVDVTGSSPSQYTHIFITAQAVWFNTNKNAGADDSGWARFQLKTPVTVDLVQQSNGTLGEVARDLRVAPGTYNSMLLLPVDPTLGLTTSAQALGASTNQEADYADASGSHQVELIIPNPEKGIVVRGSLKVPVGTASKSGLGVGLGGTPGTTNSAQTPFGSPTTVNPTPTSTTSSTTNNTATVLFGVNFDGNRDLHQFNFPKGATSVTRVLLSSSATAADLSASGGITGSLSLTNITNVTTNASIANTYSGRTAIQASAESLSADGTHHVIVASAPVQSDGTFTIYPLPSNSRDPVAYDVVIHGPNIQTIIIKNVSVTTTTPNTTGAANTTGSVATTTASGAVSLGTLIPHAAFSYLVTLPASVGATLPPGAALTFYQTLPGANEVPYAIDQVGIDPVNYSLFTPEPLAAANIDSGTYSSNGGTITLTTSVPAEKSGNYDVGATAPLLADSTPPGTIQVSAPASTMGTGAANNTTPIAIAAVPTLQPANSAGSASISVTVADTQGDDRGTLLVSHAGAVVGAVDLGTVLPNGGTVTVNGLPTGNVYDLSVLVGKSTDPTALRYESIATPVNLTSGGATAAPVTIN
jgi:uncharacterized protein DUF4382